MKLDTTEVRYSWPFVDVYFWNNPPFSWLFRVNKNVLKKSNLKLECNVPSPP
jgi:hypothetical protein